MDGIADELMEWELGIRSSVSFVPKGFRDVMWCPYANEPTFLEYRGDKPWCPLCNGNFEAATHGFIAHISKPR